MITSRVIDKQDKIILTKIAKYTFNNYTYVNMSKKGYFILKRWVLDRPIYVNIIDFIYELSNKLAKVGESKGFGSYSFLRKKLFKDIVNVLKNRNDKNQLDYIEYLNNLYIRFKEPVKVYKQPIPLPELSPSTQKSKEVKEIFINSIKINKNYSIKSNKNEDKIIIKGRIQII